MPPKQRKQYSDADLARAVERVVGGGERAVVVSPELNVPYRTLLKYAARRRRGESLVTKRRGPKPALSADGERQLLRWMRELQAAGLPVRRRELLLKANEVLRSLSGPDAEISSGWYTRFRSRHPEVSGPGEHMVVAEEGRIGGEEEEEEEEEEEKEEEEVVGVEEQGAEGGGWKTRQQLEKEGLLHTPVERAVFAVQESYAASWPPNDVVDAFELMLDSRKADLFSVMEPGELRDMWLKKQLRQVRRAAAKQ
ncbi:uncharacterized protein IUM83_01598 [Phytophthora cinnamomi]|uniref:uncharacterized protein n=1 Tax=Phytophthora cinnamomi TaxID=4785 RepID=UPI003559A181|nr:hypothetical protein IUM83_01598 [Phytophthora cinnamomi]